PTLLRTGDVTSGVAEALLILSALLQVLQGILAVHDEVAARLDGLAQVRSLAVHGSGDQLDVLGVVLRVGSGELQGRLAVGAQNHGDVRDVHVAFLGVQAVHGRGLLCGLGDLTSGASGHAQGGTCSNDGEGTADNGRLLRLHVLILHCEARPSPVKALQQLWSSYPAQIGRKLIAASQNSPLGGQIPSSAHCFPLYPPRCYPCYLRTSSSSVGARWSNRCGFSTGPGLSAGSRPIGYARTRFLKRNEGVNRKVTDGFQGRRHGRIPTPRRSSDRGDRAARVQG